MTTFDRLMANQEMDQTTSVKPFWTLDFKDEEELLKWLTQCHDDLYKGSQPRRMAMRRNLSAYRGIQYRRAPGSVTDQESRGYGRSSKNPKIAVNHMVDMVEQHVSRLTKFKPDVGAEPASLDHEDKMTAVVTDEVLEAHWYKENFDEVMRRHNRRARILGESYVFTLFDEQSGAYHPDWLREVFKKNGINKDPKNMKASEIKKILREDIKEVPRIPLIGEGGVQVTNSEGEPLYIDKPVRIGEMKYWMPLAWRVLPQRVHSGLFEDVEYLFASELMDVDDVRGDHPKQSEKIKINDSTKFWDAERLEEMASSRLVEVFHFWHRTTDRLDQGRYIKFTRDVILENGVNPYELDEKRIIPCDRLIDIEVPALLNGESTVKLGRPLQHIFNNAFSMVARNQFLFAHPKWMIPAGSVSTEALSNQQTLVQYKGAQAPILQQPNPTGNETFSWMEMAEEQLQKIMGIFGQSRGEPPKGITAAVALNFLDEQETERANTSIARHNASIRNIARQTVAGMGVFYDDTDDRLPLLLGRSRASELEFFKWADLTNINDIKINTQSSLPRQKAARVQTLFDLNERFPAEVDGRQVLDMLDIGQNDKFISIATVAIRSAEREEAKLDAKGDMPDVESHDEHLYHYKVHMAKINDPSMQVDSNKKRKEILKDHLAAHEMLMLEKMDTNPLYMEQVLAQFPGFPSFYKPGKAQLKAMVQAMTKPPPDPNAAPPMPQGEMPLMPQEVPPGALSEADMLATEVPMTGTEAPIVNA